MKPTQLFSLWLVASFGLAAPVAAQQGMMDGQGGMMGGMMGGGMMSGMNSYAMRMFDANKDGTLTPEEMTAGMHNTGIGLQQAFVFHQRDKHT